MSSAREFASPDDAASWMSSNESDHDVVVTSRVRLARNVKGYPFKARLEEEQGRQLQSHLRERLTGLKFSKDQSYEDLEHTEVIRREVLLERHLISLELARGTGSRGVLYSKNRNLSIMVNEEDHLRLQLMGPGQDLNGLLGEIGEIDEAISAEVEYAEHPRFGYLTSCPTNVGTGLRISVMLHLPALVTSKEIEKEFNSANKMKLAVRGFYGEGASFIGDFFQVSNQITLGKDAEQVLGDLLKVVPTIIEHEREVRRLIQEEHQFELEDKVFRSFGILRSARKISSQEALELLSQLRLGVCLGMLEEVPLKVINELLVMTQPAHIQVMEKRDLTEEERDVVRASYIRKRLGDS